MHSAKNSNKVSEDSKKTKKHIKTSSVDSNISKNVKNQEIKNMSRKSYIYESTKNLKLIINNSNTLTNSNVNQNEYENSLKNANSSNRPRQNTFSNEKGNVLINNKQTLKNFKNKNEKMSLEKFLNLSEDNKLTVVVDILNKSCRSNDELNILCTYITDMKSTFFLSNNKKSHKDKEKLINLGINMFFDKVDKYRILIRFGQKGDNFYFILKGSIAVLGVKEEKSYVTKEEYISYLKSLINHLEYSLLTKCIQMNCDKFPLEDLMENNFIKDFFESFKDENTEKLKMKIDKSKNENIEKNENEKIITIKESESKEIIKEEPKKLQIVFNEVKAELYDINNKITNIAKKLDNQTIKKLSLPSKYDNIDDNNDDNDNNNNTDANNNKHTRNKGKNKREKMNKSNYNGKNISALTTINNENDDKLKNTKIEIPKDLCLIDKIKFSNNLKLDYDFIKNKSLGQYTNLEKINDNDIDNYNDKIKTATNYQSHNIMQNVNNKKKEYALKQTSETNNIIKTFSQGLITKKSLPKIRKSTNNLNNFKFSMNIGNNKISSIKSKEKLSSVNVIRDRIDGNNVNVEIGIDGNYGFEGIENQNRLMKDNYFHTLDSIDNSNIENKASLDTKFLRTKNITVSKQSHTSNITKKNSSSKYLSKLKSGIKGYYSSISQQSNVYTRLKNIVTPIELMQKTSIQSIVNEKELQERISIVKDELRQNISNVNVINSANIKKYTLVSTPKYYPIGIFGKGDHFGDLIIEAKLQQSPYTILSLEDTFLAGINSHYYKEIIKDKKTGFIHDNVMTILNHPVFDGFSFQEIKGNLYKQCETFMLKKNEILFNQFDVSENIYILLEGELELEFALTINEISTLLKNYIPDIDQKFFKFMHIFYCSEKINDPKLMKFINTIIKFKYKHCSKGSILGLVDLIIDETFLEKSEFEYNEVLNFIKDSSILLFLFKAKFNDEANIVDVDEEIKILSNNKNLKLSNNYVKWLFTAKIKSESAYLLKINRNSFINFKKYNRNFINNVNNYDKCLHKSLITHLLLIFENLLYKYYEKQEIEINRNISYNSNHNIVNWNINSDIIIYDEINDEYSTSKDRINDEVFDDFKLLKEKIKIIRNENSIEKLTMYKLLEERKKNWKEYDYLKEMIQNNCNNNHKNVYSNSNLLVNNEKLNNIINLIIKDDKDSSKIVEDTISLCYIKKMNFCQLFSKLNEIKSEICNKKLNFKSPFYTSVYNVKYFMNNNYDNNDNDTIVKRKMINFKNNESIKKSRELIRDKTMKFLDENYPVKTNIKTEYVNNLNENQYKNNSKKSNMFNKSNLNSSNWSEKDNDVFHNDFPLNLSNNNVDVEMRSNNNKLSKISTVNFRNIHLDYDATGKIEKRFRISNQIFCSNLNLVDLEQEESNNNKDLLKNISCNDSKKLRDNYNHQNEIINCINNESKLNKNKETSKGISNKIKIQRKNRILVDNTSKKNDIFIIDSNKNKNNKSSKYCNKNEEINDKFEHNYIDQIDNNSKEKLTLLTLNTDTNTNHTLYNTDNDIDLQTNTIESLKSQNLTINKFDCNSINYTSEKLVSTSNLNTIDVDSKLKVNLASNYDKDNDSKYNAKIEEKLLYFSKNEKSSSNLNPIFNFYEENKDLYVSIANDYNERKIKNFSTINNKQIISSKSKKSLPINEAYKTCMFNIYEKSRVSNLELYDSTNRKAYLNNIEFVEDYGNNNLKIDYAGRIMGKKFIKNNNFNKVNLMNSLKNVSDKEVKQLKLIKNYKSKFI